MGCKSLGTTALLTIGALLSPSAATASEEGGGLRRKRSASHQYKSNRQTPSQQRDNRHLTEEAATNTDDNNAVGEDLARRFFLPASHHELDDIDMRELILQMNFDGSMSIMTPVPTRSPTKRPSVSPTFSTSAPSTSTAPTFTDCTNPGTCENRLQEQIYQISERVGTVDALDDPNSAQSQASDWILEECDASIPIDPCTASQIILNEQRYALAVMYFSLSGEGWNAGSNPSLDKDAGEGTWLSGLNYCDWGSEISSASGSSNQLVCDDFGNVLNLNLQSNNMAGPIPPEIGVFVYMTSYISFFNAQAGPIPTSLGLIEPLQTFDVESNNMDGNLFQPEYSGPGGLTEIVNFRASLNNFRGNIPTEIGQWTKLQNLWFADNEMTGTIPSEVGNLVDMNAFLFYKNQIAGTIPPDIGNLDKLTWIDMEDNQIVGTIPEEFYSNLELEEVIFKNNSLSGTVSELVGDLTKLSTFWASFNELSGSIPTTFGNCLNLEELELQNNRLEGPIPEAFGNLESIEFLSMEQNGLTGTIPGGLFGINLNALRILYLNNNQLNGPVPENWGQSQRLKDLWMNDNVLTGTLPIIAEGEFLFLEELLVNNNDLTGEVDDSICLIRNDTVPGGNLGVFHSDCQPPPGGGVPQIICSCCTACFV
eukprot:CAMPEP_0172297450 /NCGR_PEP_ID=MMETSP1058-20130122/468_1 /TAXON_ID=83371 /ORGANISM="Detonula confervacea, Strain CCMP 353" /LENGTH=650 /DNA_ID=CAMNT_0013006605 /DNA_START=35 /DNA_END=1987 /DNA_ORIENTATION=-